MSTNEKRKSLVAKKSPHLVKRVSIFDGFTNSHLWRFSSSIVLKVKTNHLPIEYFASDKNNIETHMLINMKKTLLFY